MPLTEMIRASDELLTEVVRGIKLYFNKTLEDSLLYRSERKQYADILAKSDSALPSDIYGVEHFLRLFGNYQCFLCLQSPTLMTVILTAF
jgi:MRG